MTLGFGEVSILGVRCLTIHHTTFLSVYTGFFFFLLKSKTVVVVAALLEDLQQEVRYITVPSLILPLFKNSVRNVIRNMIVISDAVYTHVLSKISKDVDDNEKLMEDLKLIQHYLDIINSFYLAVDNISIVIVNLLNTNLPADKAPRLVNEILTGYDIWKQH